MSKVIRISDETYRRLQALGTPFRKSERGTPDKVIRALLDRAAAERFTWRPGDVAVCSCGVICGDGPDGPTYTRVLPPDPDCPVHGG